MKLLIFGCTRGVGLEATKQALARGHEVVAFARRPAAVPAGARVVTGDVMDAPSVAAAFADGFAPDAIVLALGGAGIWSRDYVCSRGTENVLAAVRSARAAAGASAPPPRLVCCSSMGVGDSAPLIPGFVRWLLTHPLADKEPQERALRESGLPYVILRPTGLRNDAPRGRAALAVLEAQKLPTSAVARADIAALMLDACAGDELLGKTVGVANLAV